MDYTYELGKILYYTWLESGKRQIYITSKELKDSFDEAIRYFLDKND